MLSYDKLDIEVKEYSNNACNFLRDAYCLCLKKRRKKGGRKEQEKY